MVIRQILLIAAIILYSIIAAQVAREAYLVQLGREKKKYNKKVLAAQCFAAGLIFPVTISITIITIWRYRKQKKGSNK